jgi:hypothetical protein
VSPSLRSSSAWFAAEDHLAAEAAGHRAHVDDVVRGAHHFLIMLHHDHGIAQVAQLLQHVDQALGIAGVQADAGLVQDVHAAHQAAAQGGGQVDALGLAAAEGIAAAVQGEVAHAHIVQVAQAVPYLLQQALGDPWSSLPGSSRAWKNSRHSRDRACAPELGDVVSGHLHVAGLGLQAGAMADRCRWSFRGSGWPARGTGSCSSSVHNTGRRHRCRARPWCRSRADWRWASSRSR